MFKKGIKKEYLKQTHRIYEDNFTCFAGNSMNTVIYKTPDFKLFYNGGDKMVVKARLGHFIWVANARPFMKNRYEKEFGKDAK